jgi:hypothetical protein
MTTLLMMLFVWLAPAAVVLDNDYVRVSKNEAPCAAAGPACTDRVIVALGDIVLGTSTRRRMTRGDIAVFGAKESYAPPTGGDYLEAAFKPGSPPVQGPPVRLPPDKNRILFDGPRFFVFEELLPPGDTRARHSHAQRVVIVLNATRLQQWPDGQPELFRDQTPDDVRFNPPVTHVVKTVGKAPLRNIVIELKP